MLVASAGGPHTAVHDEAGRLVRTIDVGRGVTRVLSTIEGQVWIGYDKESPRDRYFSRHGGGGEGSVGHVAVFQMVLA